VGRGAKFEMKKPKITCDEMAMNSMSQFKRFFVVAPIKSWPPSTIFSESRYMELRTEKYFSWFIATSEESYPGTDSDNSDAEDRMYRICNFSIHFLREAKTYYTRLNSETALDVSAFEIVSL